MEDKPNLLKTAIDEGEFDIVKSICDKGKYDIKSKNSNHENILHYILKSKGYSDELFYYFIEKGIDYNNISSSGESVLGAAVRNKRLNACKTLLELKSKAGDIEFNKYSVFKDDVIPKLCCCAIYENEEEKSMTKYEWYVNDKRLKRKLLVSVENGETYYSFYEKKFNDKSITLIKPNQENNAKRMKELYKDEWETAFINKLKGSTKNLLERDQEKRKGVNSFLDSSYFRQVKT